ncbi:MAG: DUF4375 domain-containing protein [Armatimonadota bacterium]
MVRMTPVLLIIAALCGCSKPHKPVSDKASADMPLPVTNNSQPKLTLKAVAKLPDDTLEDVATTNTFDKVKCDASTGKEMLAALSHGQKIIYITSTLEGDVFNGGFHQYFCNTGGQFAIDAFYAYKEIGAVKHANLVGRAIVVAVKEKGLRDSIKQSQNQLEAFAASYKKTELGELDDEFYRLEDEEPAWPLRAKYIRKHADEFVEK